MSETKLFIVRTKCEKECRLIYLEENELCVEKYIDKGEQLKNVPICIHFIVCEQNYLIGFFIYFEF